MSVERIRKHLQQAVENARLELYPFPHMLIENAWPEDIYEQIQKHNLLDKYAEQTKSWLEKHTSTNPQYKIRKQIDLHDIKQATNNDEARQFWGTIYDAILGDGWYLKLINKKYATYFATHFGPLCKDDAWVDDRWTVKDFFVQRHDIDYFIGPHTDTDDRVFTNIWTFPKENTHEHLGTALYTAMAGDLSPGGRHYGWKSFSKQAQMPYRKNCLFVFFKSRWAFHAVEKIKDIDETKRYGMQLQVRERGLREITEDTPEYQVLLKKQT